MDGATTAVEALPQRAPRGRRQQDRSRNDGDAPAAADNGTLKRSRQEATDEATQRRRCDGDTSAAADGAVTVTWHSSSERPATAGEAVDDKNGGGHDGQHYEYLDHTADIQLHSWGATVEEAFGWSALAMFNYMTPLAGFVDEEMTTTHTVDVSGHDLQSLLFAFLDELLFVFHTESMVVRQLRVGRLDRDNWTLTAVASGSRFVPGQHEPGTEVKAITYSAMQILERERADVYVIVDI